MKRLFYPPPIRCLLMVIMLLVASNTFLFAEGSINFRNYPGHRLFYNVEQNQQLKVYAADGEFINVGSSHVGINDGTIEVYNPSGQLVATFDGSGNTAIIFNDIQELNGPTGGDGYEPGVIPVGAGEGGVWSIRLRYPNPQRQRFVSNLLNGDAWTRAADQPNTNIFDQRVALAWDVTVTQGGAGNNGGSAVSGRLYSNEYISILDGNSQPGSGRSTSPTFYVLTRGGYLYQVDFTETDPWGFPIHSNNLGLVDGDITPTYMSAAIGGDVIEDGGPITRSADIASWTAGNTYLFEPQAEDAGVLSNNKIFFSRPDPNLPTSALVTDIDPSRQNTHTTWLLNQVPVEQADARPFTFLGILPANGTCTGDLVAEEGVGGHFVFESRLEGQAVLTLDLDNNGSFTDAVDLVLTKNVGFGVDSIFWDGSDGTGAVIPANPNFNFAFNLTVRGGEIHLLLADIENNVGGVTFTRINGPDSPDSDFYYDHTGIGGDVSGGGTAGNALATTNPFTYSDGFGNQNMLDQWAFIEANNFGTGILAINIEADCPLSEDHDMDGIPDVVDIDDDNDGVPDLLEFCHPEEGFACLPGGLDPSADEDGDGVQNYLDANDAAVNSGCTDANADGICDQIIAAYDTDGDNVPDHFDLDSDNDGISDLVEAGHNQADTDGNGIIDGLPAVFGENGLFSGLETNDSPTGVANYVPWDFDGDGIPDHDDLDSDNDGILDVVEAGYASSDTDQDGRIDGGANADGLVPLIDPALTGQGIPLPIDWDGDGVPDWHDLDSDQDGVLDVVEAGYANADTNQDGRIDDGNGNVPTVNSDGIPPVMNPNGTGQGIPLPIDWDGDGVPDWHDLDSDNDGILDVVEAGYIDSDSNQDGRIDDGNGNPPAVDANGIAPVINVNGDGTGIPLPIDWDSDGVPDWHDLDSDNDGILDVIEGGYQGSDTNLDGRIDDGSGNIPTVNADGLPPVMTTGGPINLPPDTDTDGVRDWHDLDSDNDGINDTVENINPDGDNDGFIGTGPITVDANGIAIADANGPVVPNTPLVNTDNDGPGDFRDLDADGDGINDVIEGGLADPDGDGIIGTGTPTVNPFGQSTDGTTSNPTDTDGDGTPDFQQVDEACEAPAASVLAASATNLCEGESLTLSTTAVTGADVSYTWTAVGATGTSEFVTNVPTFTLDALTAANSGTYTLVVTRDTCVSGISNVVSITVSPSPTAPVLTASETDVCEGTSVTLNAGDALDNTTYEWTLTTADGAASVVATTTTPTLTLDALNVNQAGTYTVVASTGGGACPSGASNGVAITVVAKPTTPTLSSSADGACEGEAITLTAAPAGDANTTYEWTLTTADGTATVVSTTDVPMLVLDSLTADQAGTYTVVAQGGGGSCPSDASNGVAISVSPRPAAPELTVDKDIHCEGDTLEFMATPIEGATYNFTFTNPAGRVDPLVTTNLPSAIIAGLVAANTGTYQVTVVLDGCESLPSNDVAIDVAAGGLPNATATSSPPAGNPVCEGTDITLTATEFDNVTYEWAGPNGVIATTSETVIVGATAADNGEYTVTITTANGCPTTLEPITVQVDPKPATPTITTDNTTVCPGEGFMLSTDAVAGDNITYEWFLNGNSVGTTDDPELVIIGATEADGGNYTVTVNNGGCPSDPSDPVEITVQPPVEGDITMEPAGGVCEGETVTLTAPSAEGATYEWTGPNDFTSTDATVTLENVSAANNGDYSVVVTLNGCPNDFGPTTLEINPKPATPTASSDKDSACPGEAVTLSTAEATGDAITYDWLLNGEVVANTTEPTLLIEDFQEGNAGDYTVVVKDGSCPSEPSEPVTVTLKENLEGVSASSNSPICIGDPINLMVTDVEGATFAWEGPNGFTSTEQNPVIEAATEADAGDYTVTVTIDGCPATIPPTTVEVTPKPDAPTVTLAEENVCEGVAGMITVTSPDPIPEGTTFSVLDAAGMTVASSTTNTIEVPTDGLEGLNFYTVISTIDGGCPSEPSESVVLNVAPKPEEEAMILTELMQDDCGGMIPTSLEAAVPTEGTGMWTNSNPDVVFTDAANPVTDVMGLEDGDMITWTLSNETCGEYSSASLTISIPMPPMTTATDDAFTILNTESVSGNVVGNDTPNNGSVTVISGPTNGTGTIDEFGNISYTPNEGFVGNDQFVYELCNTVCPDAPCDQATVNITVNQDPANLDCMVPDVISPNGDGLNDMLVIECSDFKNVSLKIFNRWGDLVFESDNYNNNWGGTHDGADLPPGPYYYIFEETGAGSPEPTTGCVSIAR